MSATSETLVKSVSGSTVLVVEELEWILTVIKDNRDNVNNPALEGLNKSQELLEEIQKRIHS